MIKRTLPKRPIVGRPKVKGKIVKPRTFFNGLKINAKQVPIVLEAFQKIKKEGPKKAGNITYVTERILKEANFRDYPTAQAVAMRLVFREKRKNHSSK